MAVPARLTAREGRKFAFTVGIAFLVLGAVSLWRGRYLPPRILGTLGGALLLAGLLVPGKLTLLNSWWMGLAHAISKVTSPIFLGVAYFLVLTPLGWVLRALGKNPLRHREKDGGFWAASSSDGRSNLETQF
jgi:hypothetical protein